MVEEKSRGRSNNIQSSWLLLCTLNIVYDHVMPIVSFECMWGRWEP